MSFWSFIADNSGLIPQFIYHRWFEDGPPPPSPASENLPKTDEGSPIPLIYGRCRVRAPALAWAGNWFPSPRGSAGFTYFIHLLWVVGAPFFGGKATLQSIYVNNFLLQLVPVSPLPGIPTTAGKSDFVTSNGFDLFGGPDKGGGIVGNVEFLDGRSTQTVSDGVNDGNHLTAIEAFLTGDLPTSPPAGYTTTSFDASLLPSYRNLAICFLYDWDIGETPHILPYSFEVTSLSTGTASDMGHSLTDDACPAAVIADLLTSPWGKLALPVSKIDIPSFQAASTTLFGEGHGYSRSIEQSEDATQIIGDILHQIDGGIFEEPTTGKLVLWLARFDYDPNDLDDINPDNAEPAGSSWYQIQGWSETMNAVRVKFTDRDNNYVDGFEPGQNMANVVGQGGKLRPVDRQYVGCCTRALAKKLASRELAAVSQPMVKVSVIVNRNFYQARPGAVYTLTWPELGINKMVMRVARVDLGQLHDGRIKLDLIRDVFDVSLGAF